jgi:hypothetical protein
MRFELHFGRGAGDFVRGLYAWRNTVRAKQ